MKSLKTIIKNNIAGFKLPEITRYLVAYYQNITIPVLSERKDKKP